MSEVAESKCLSGSCLCGGSSFMVPASSVRFGFASCHCSVCRAAHAAPFVQWSGLNADKSQDFAINADYSQLTGYKSTAFCTRYFCKTCGTHLYIKYDDDCASTWAGEIHFPTALLTKDSVAHLEEAMQAAGKPRYIHVFMSDRSPCLGKLEEWAAGPKYGGETGMEPYIES